MKFSLCMLHCMCFLFLFLFYLKKAVYPLNRVTLWCLMYRSCHFLDGFLWLIYTEVYDTSGSESKSHPYPVRQNILFQAHLLLELSLPLPSGKRKPFFGAFWFIWNITTLSLQFYVHGMHLRLLFPQIIPKKWDNNWQKLYWRKRVRNENPKFTQLQSYTTKWRYHYLQAIRYSEPRLILLFI